jgi:hypothetical protein
MKEKIENNNNDIVKGNIMIKLFKKHIIEIAAFLVLAAFIFGYLIPEQLPKILEKDYSILFPYDLSVNSYKLLKEKNHDKAYTSPEFAVGYYNELLKGRFDDSYRVILDDGVITLHEAYSILFMGEANRDPIKENLSLSDQADILSDIWESQKIDSHADVVLEAKKRFIEK